LPQSFSDLFNVFKPGFIHLFVYFDVEFTKGQSGLQKKGSKETAKEKEEKLMYVCEDRKLHKNGRGSRFLARLSCVHRMPLRGGARRMGVELSK
jgi:hypothetical protein